MEQLKEQNLILLKSEAFDLICKIKVMEARLNTLILEIQNIEAKDNGKLTHI